MTQSFILIEMTTHYDRRATTSASSEKQLSTGVARSVTIEVHIIKDKSHSLKDAHHHVPVHCYIQLTSQAFISKVSLTSLTAELMYETTRLCNCPY